MSNSEIAQATTSVILTCYNEQDFIGTAVDSVLSQTAVDRIREVVIVDDGSTDNSRTILDEMSKRISVLRVIHSQNLGVSAARNLAIEKTTSPYIAFLDGDDAWVPDKLARQLPILDKEPSVGLVYSDYYEFEDIVPKKLVRCYVRSYRSDQRNQLAEFFVHDAPIIPSTVVVRRCVLDQVGCFDPTIKYAEDTELWLRVVERYLFQHVPFALVEKRQHTKRASQDLNSFWPVCVATTETYSKRNPELRPLARKRLSRKAAKIAWSLIDNGDRRRGAAYLATSIRYDAFNPRTYAYASFALLPSLWAQRAHSLARSLRGFIVKSRPKLHGL